MVELEAHRARLLHYLVRREIQDLLGLVGAEMPLTSYLLALVDADLCPAAGESALSGLLVAAGADRGPAQTQASTVILPLTPESAPGILEVNASCGAPISDAAPASPASPAPTAERVRRTRGPNRPKAAAVAPPTPDPLVTPGAVDAPKRTRKPRGEQIANSEREIGSLASVETPDPFGADTEQKAYEYVASCVRDRKGIDPMVVMDLLGTYRSKAIQFISSVTEQEERRVRANARLVAGEGRLKAGLGDLIAAVSEAGDDEVSFEADYQNQPLADAA